MLFWKNAAAAALYFEKQKSKFDKMIAENSATVNQHGTDSTLLQVRWIAIYILGFVVSTSLTTENT
jgi:hypothetical protein